MSLEESRRSQRPYRYGMVLLCVGALINWLGLAENYVEPVRYVGVACIVAGALLICAAMCCWLHAPPTRTSTHMQHTSHPITAQVIIRLLIHRYIASLLIHARLESCGKKYIFFFLHWIYLPTSPQWFSFTDVSTDISPILKMINIDRNLSDDSKRCRSSRCGWRPRGLKRF